MGGRDGAIPVFPLTTPVRVQVLPRFTPTCWEATFGTAVRNDTEASRRGPIPSFCEAGLGRFATPRARPSQP